MARCADSTIGEYVGPSKGSPGHHRGEGHGSALFISLVGGAFQEWEDLDYAVGVLSQDWTLDVWTCAKGGTAGYP